MESGIRMGNPRINREGQIEVLKEAIFYSLLAWIKYQETIGSYQQQYRDFYLSICNNIVCFIWDLWDLSEDRSEFEFELNEVLSEVQETTNAPFAINLEDMKEFIVAHLKDSDQDPKFNDTLMKFYVLAGDVENCRLYRDRMSHVTTEGTSRSNMGVRYDLFRVNPPLDLFEYALQRVDKKENRHAVALHLTAKTT